MKMEILFQCNSYLISDDPVTVLRDRLHYIFEKRIKEQQRDQAVIVPSIESIKASILYLYLN